MKDYYTDFSLKCGSWTGSFYALCKAIVIYIILPLAFIALINGIEPRLGEIIPAGSVNFGPVFGEFVQYLNRYMLYSIPLIVLAIFVGYYPAGNYARIPFKFISATYLAVMLLMFTDGGHMSVSLDGSGLAPNLSMINLTLDVVGIIYILAIIAFVKGFLAFTEFSDNRKKYLTALAEKFNDKDEKHNVKGRRNGDFDEDDDDVPEKKKKKKSDDDDDE